ncbi:MAG: lactate utilization protein C [Pseudonocardia sp.]
MSARSEVLARIRAANAAAAAAGGRATAGPVSGRTSAAVTGPGDAAAAGGAVAAPEPPRGYRTAGEPRPGAPALLDLLRDRLVDYRATVLDTDTGGIPAAVGQALAGVTGPVVVPPDLPAGWCPDGVPDRGQSPTELDGYAAVVTACVGACAETGTVALDASPDQGRRALSLVPDVHVCVVRADQVVATVPELLARLAPTRPITLISGPSATSDIELERVEGVHGPRTLIVVLVRTDPDTDAGPDTDADRAGRATPARG